MDFELSEIDDILVVTIHGNTTVEDIKHILDQTRDASGYSHSARLWDFRNSAFDFVQSEVIDIAAYATTMDAQPSKVAMLVKEDLSYGVSRVYEVFRHTEFTQINVFRDKGEALAWLKE